MADERQLEFFLLRYFPNVVTGEFINIGLVAHEPSRNGSGFADVRFRRDWRVVRCHDPQADIEVLESLEREMRANLREMTDRQALMRRLEDSFSNSIELSPVKGCLTQDPAKEIEALAELYFKSTMPAGRVKVSGRQQILATMKAEFERVRVWDLLMHGVPAAPYTKAGDPFKFDFGYRVSDEIKLFHAVSIKASVDQAMGVTWRFGKVTTSRLAGAKASLVAVVDDDLDRKAENIRFVIAAMEEEKIRVAAAREMPEIAEMARKDLRV